jgi:hypothetical protein
MRSAWKWRLLPRPVSQPVARVATTALASTSPEIFLKAFTPEILRKSLSLDNLSDAMAEVRVEGELNVRGRQYGRKGATETQKYVRSLMGKRSHEFQIRAN